jgi:hypothetical protein
LRRTARRQPRRSLAALAGGALVLLVVGAARTSAQQSVPTVGSVAGQVVDSATHPIEDVLVSLDSLPWSVSTDATGHFRLDDVGAGDHLLWIRQLGFQPEAFHITVVPGQVKRVLARVARSGVTLPTVTTQAAGQWGKPERLNYTSKYDEFYERRAESVSGRFYTHEDLQAMHEEDVPDMLRLVPGLRVRQTADGTILGFPGCTSDHILIMVNLQRVWPAGGGGGAGMGTVGAAAGGNGMTATKADPMDDPLSVIGTLHLENIEAMEVYKTLGSLPMEAATGGFCGEIRLWTR